MVSLTAKLKINAKLVYVEYQMRCTLAIYNIGTYLSSVVFKINGMKEITTKKKFTILKILSGIVTHRVQIVGPLFKSIIYSFPSTIFH